MNMVVYRPLYTFVLEQTKCLAESIRFSLHSFQIKCTKGVNETLLKNFSLYTCFYLGIGGLFRGLCWHLSSKYSLLPSLFLILWAFVIHLGILRKNWESHKETSRLEPMSRSQFFYILPQSSIVQVTLNCSQ